MKRFVALLAAGLTCLAAATSSALSEQTETAIAPGLTYTRMQRPGPVVVHVLRASLTEPSLRPAVALGGRRVLEVQTLSDLIAAQPEDQQVAGAINGGYAVLGESPYRGSAIGLLIAGGELLCDPWPTQRSALLIGADGKPRIELIGIRGKVAGADRQIQRIGGLNRPRLPGEIVLYTPRFNPATKIVEPGWQLVLSGVFTGAGGLRAGQDYHGRVEAIVDGRVNVEIPPDGVVLAASGPSAAWLANHKLGEELIFSFELVPDVGEVRDALGAGPRLVRDGQVSVEAEQERLTIARVTGKQPRSAVGFNDQSLLLVAVDGRNPDHSLGIDQDGLGQLMKELGCRQAMELDGGGATTLFVRDRVINQPSDGEQRPLANALVLFTTAKLSDKPLPPPTLAGTGAAPVAETGLPVAPGKSGVLARLRLAPEELATAAGEVTPLTVSGLDAAGQPAAVPADQIRYEVVPEALGAVDAQGRFTAAKAGIGRITVRVGALTAAVAVKVKLSAAPELPTIKPSDPGTGGVLRPDLTEQPAKPAVKPDGAPAGEEPPARTVTPPGGEWQRPEPTLPEGERRLIDGFEQAKHWAGKVYPPEVVGSFAVVDKNIRMQGTHCGELRYDFTTTTGTRAAYALFGLVVGFPKAISVYVFGDGNGNWLRAQLRDKQNKIHTVDLTQHVNWDHQWRRCTALIPEGIEGPLTLDCIYLVQHRPEVQNAGALYFDQLEGIY